MKRALQLEVFNDFVVKMKEIILSKSIDYADVNTDVLSNFKLAGNISGLNAQLNCLSLISTKVARLGVLLNKDGAPNNESIDDTIIDLANYTVLLHMILKDK